MVSTRSQSQSGERASSPAPQQAQSYGTRGRRRAGVAPRQPTPDRAVVLPSEEPSSDAAAAAPPPRTRRSAVRVLPVIDEAPVNPGGGAPVTVASAEAAHATPEPPPPQQHEPRDLQMPAAQESAEAQSQEHGQAGGALPETDSDTEAAPGGGGMPSPHQTAAVVPCTTHDPWADISDGGSSDEEGGGNDGMHSLMSTLAASIKAAFAVTAGPRSASQGQDVAAVRSSQDQAVPAAGGELEEDEEVARALARWKPAMPLPLQKPSKRAVLQLSIQAEKDKTLAKQLMVPPPGSKKAAPKAPETAGKGWYDLPAQKIDDDLKRELRLLRLRGAYDPKRFYKSFDTTKFPKHFAMGTVLEGPTEFLHGRLDRAQRRKSTLTEQLLADVDLRQARKKRFSKLQEDAVAHQRVKKRKTDLPRKPKSHHRAKH